jgi:glutathione S-transferase
MDKITVTGFRWAPPFAQGLVRDLRVRWALEEAGLPYEVTLIDFGDLSSHAYRQKHPCSRSLRLSLLKCEPLLVVIGVP